ncbi:hypothetical protein [Cohnella abietis]
MKIGFQVKGLNSAAIILFAGGVELGIGACFYRQENGMKIT